MYDNVSSFLFFYSHKYLSHLHISLQTLKLIIKYISNNSEIYKIINSYGTNLGPVKLHPPRVLYGYVFLLAVTCIDKEMISYLMHSLINNEWRVWQETSRDRRTRAVHCDRRSCFLVFKHCQHINIQRKTSHT